MAATSDMLGRPAPRPANSVLEHASARDADPAAAPGAHGPAPSRARAPAGAPERPEDAATAGTGVRLLVAGGAGFIGSTTCAAGSRAPRRRVRVLDKLTYAGRRENLAGLDEDRFELVEARHRRPRRVGAAVEGCDAVVNFAAESHVDRSIESPGEFIQTDVFGTYVLLEAARDAGIRHLQISTDEVYGDFEQGSATEESPLDPSSPYSASKAGRRPAGRGLRAHLRRRGADRPRLEQLRPAPASREADPTLHPERARRRPAAGLRRRHAGPQLALRRGLLRGDRRRPRARASRARVYNAGGPDELPNIEVVKRILELTGRDESLIEYVTRPARPRPPLLTRLGERLRSSAGSRRSASIRASSGPWPGTARTSAWWEPIRSGEYREYYERQYGKTLGAEWGSSRIETALDGARPDRGRPSTATSAASWSRPSARTEMQSLGIDCRVRPGQPVALRRKGPPRHPLPDLARPGKLVRCLRGRILDVAVDLRRDSPTFGGGRPTSSATRISASCSFPVGFGHGFCVLIGDADVDLPALQLLRPRDGGGIAWDDPEIGSVAGLRPDPLRARPERAPARRRGRLAHRLASRRPSDEFRRRGRHRGVTSAP